MITNELLQEKYRIQKMLDKQANYDLIQYVANSHARVKEIEAQYGIKFKYGAPRCSTFSRKDLDKSNEKVKDDS